MSDRSESPRDYEIVSKEEVESSLKKDQEERGGGPVQVIFVFFFRVVDVF